MNIKKYFLVGCMVTLFASCDNLLDINTDPNNLADSEESLTLPVGQIGVVTRLEVDFNILGSMLAQYWTTGPTASQYDFIDQYDITTNDFGAAWRFIYTSPLSDLEYVKTVALEDDQANYAAVCQLLQVYLYQIMVDLYDQIPFSEALQGTANLTPGFDGGEDVYDDLIVMADEAIGWIDQSSTAVTPGDDDLIYGGDMALWLKFANTLKLKIYIRQAYERPTVAEDGIAALYSDGAEFLSPGEEAMISFSDNTHNQNPLYAELADIKFENLVASETFIDELDANNDPRLEELFEPNDDDEYVGLLQGEGTANGGVFGDFARPSQETILIPTAAAYLMTGYESLFLQAEAVAQGWVSGDDEALYDEAVTAAFDFWDVDATTLLAGDYAYDGELSTIYYQKWLAFCGKQGFEGWTEWRRTGVPTLSVSDQAATLVNEFPLRLIWPIEERSANPNVPSLESVDTPVWWDTTF